MIYISQLLWDILEDTDKDKIMDVVKSINSKRTLSPAYDTQTSTSLYIRTSKGIVAYDSILSFLPYKLSNTKIIDRLIADYTSLEKELNATRELNELKTSLKTLKTVLGEK